MAPITTNQKNGADNPLPAPLVAAIAELGWTRPTPIQEHSLEPLLAGRDLLGLAPTGTGKTGAYLVPLLARLFAQPPADPPTPSALILAPTRELATQIDALAESLGGQAGLLHYALVGGVDAQPQITALEAGGQLITATPGRLLDLHRRGVLKLDGVRTLVVDEADRMLDLGFLPDLRAIGALLSNLQQTAMFSATLPAGVDRAAAEFLRDPVCIDLGPTGAVDSIEQHLYYVNKADKYRLLVHIVQTTGAERMLVFVRTRRSVDHATGVLHAAGIPSSGIHSDMPQQARRQALEAFRSGESPVLVATDLASRGLHIDRISHVLNLDLPSEPEAYIHRIGRTGRAGAFGVALSFCAPAEHGSLELIEARVGRPLQPILTHPFHDHELIPGAPNRSRRRRSKRRHR